MHTHSLGWTIFLHKTSKGIIGIIYLSIIYFHFCCYWSSNRKNIQKDNRAGSHTNVSFMHAHAQHMHTHTHPPSLPPIHPCMHAQHTCTTHMYPPTQPPTHMISSFEWFNVILEISVSSSLSYKIFVHHLLTNRCQRLHCGSELQLWSYWFSAMVLMSIK